MTKPPKSARPAWFPSGLWQRLHAPAGARVEIGLRQNLVGRVKGDFDDPRLLLGLEKGLDQIAHVGGLARNVEADIFVETPALEIVASHLLAAAVGDDVNLACLARFR